MWAPVTLLLLVGVAVASSDYNHAWESQKEYQYLVRTRTLAGLDDIKNQYTGLQLRGLLTIQVKSPELLNAKLLDAQYARINSELPDGPETEIPEQALKHRDLSMSGKPFQIQLKHGMIRNLLVDPAVPTWELNILKGLVSQLQIDTQGENAIDRRYAQIPSDENSAAIFRAMEDSVGGKCEVLYDIKPINDDRYQEKPDKLPLPHLRGEGQHFAVKKVKNFEKCLQRQIYHYSVYDPLQKTKPEKRDKVLSELALTEMVISGDLKRFTIQSSTTKNRIAVKPDQSNSSPGSVNTLTKLTLVKKSQLSDSMLGVLEPTNLESTGNLVYAYNNPFLATVNRKERLPSISQNSEQMQSSEVGSFPSRGNLYDYDKGDASSSSSEERIYSRQKDISLFQHSEHGLDFAPYVPLSPFFVGYRGRSITMSDKINVVDRAENLISQIANELEPNQTSPNTLEKYTILKNLLRVMKLEDYAELEKRVFRNKDGQTHRNINAWSVLRDSVTQAATGPALLTIEKWIKDEKVKGIEAARIITQIPRNVREPAAAYVKKVFEIITSPTVQKQRQLNVSAPLALAELIRNSHVRQEYYPIHTFGPMILKDDNEASNVYIPWFIKQLQQGFKEKDNLKIQIYIMALGITGHPKIISVFEPYLEGTKEATKFQRLLMVSSMSTLAKLKPKLVGPIMYKLYVNKEDDHEIRCMAVHQFIMMNPPLVMLQELATNTNSDPSEQVSSVVKTTLESLAKLQLPHMQPLTNKARNVLDLMNPKQFDKWNSRGYYKDWEDQAIKELCLQTVVGDDSKIPKMVRLDVSTIFDFLEQPTLEVGYAVSSMKQLIDKLSWPLGQEDEEAQESQKSRVEKLASTLKLMPEQLSKLEGNVLINTLYGLMFYPYDDQTINKVAQELKDFLRKDRLKLNLNLFNNYEKTLSVPTENGLPFTYTMETPMLIKLQADLKDKSVNSETGYLDMLIINKIQKRVGFVAPFEQQNYITGIDNDRMMQLPIEYEVGVKEIKQNHGSGWLKLRPRLQQSQMDSPIKTLHISTVPFTVRQNIFDLQPISYDKNLILVLNSKKHETILQKDAFSLRIESDVKESTERVLDRDPVGLLLQQSQILNNDLYKRIELLINPEKAAKKELLINVAFDTMPIANNQESFDVKHNILMKDNLGPLNENRRMEIMKSLSRGYKTGNVFVWELNYALPMEESTQQQVVTVGMVKTVTPVKGDKLSLTYLDWRSQSPEKKFEVCYLQEMRSAPSTPLDYEFTIENTPKDEISGELRYGESCSSGSKLRADVTVARSKKLTELVKNSKVAKKCINHIQSGHKALQACQMATELAQTKDELEIRINMPAIMRKIITKITDFWSSLLPKTQLKVLNVEGAAEHEIVTLRMTMSPEDVVPKAYLPILKLSNTLPSPMEALFKTGPMLRDVEIFQKKIQKDSCTLDKSMVLTFDNRLYPVALGACKHVLMIANPENRKHPSTIPEKSRVAVLAKDANDGSKIVTVLMGDQEVKLMKWDQRIKILVNGVEVPESEKHHQFIHGNKIVHEITVLPDKSIQVFSKKYGINVVYDGERVQLLVSDKYRNALRGLCGNYDSNPDTDFITPKNCLLRKPEQFAAMYALTDENCPEFVLENKRKAEQTEMCQEWPKKRRSHNVFDDEGTEEEKIKPWGYHKITPKKQHGLNRQNEWEINNMKYQTRVVEEDNSLCFTVSPVPVCSNNFKPMERKLKKYGLHCMPKNEESMALKHRVENGANPDFTRKSVSITHTFQVPTLCVAA